MRTATPSPCINVCVLDDISGYCKGCFRTAEEVAVWVRLSEEEQQKVTEQLAARRPT